MRLPGGPPGAGTTDRLAADHVIAATGYRVDLAAMGFLGHELRTALAVSRGTPRLGAGYVSSEPGLYFTGLPAAASYGPVMRFVCGTEFASPRLARHLAAAHGRRPGRQRSPRRDAWHAESTHREPLLTGKRHLLAAHGKPHDAQTSFSRSAAASILPVSGWVSPSRMDVL